MDHQSRLLGRMNQVAMRRNKPFAPKGHLIVAEGMTVNVVVRQAVRYDLLRRRPAAGAEGLRRERRVHLGAQGRGLEMAAEALFRRLRAMGGLCRQVADHTLGVGHCLDRAPQAGGCFSVGRFVELAQGSGDGVVWSCAGAVRGRGRR